ncbi:MAG: TIGR03663 family protein, partial [Chloroflexi bacterium]|nr:TIGR03663 family protein [Chloroflexota bacterium]
ALHHDESLHAVYSWYLFIGRGYQHDPLMHGPFQFHGIALLYFLFGVSDFTARLLVALAGTGAVAASRLLHPWLGRGGALAAAAMLTFSPLFLSFGRFARNDVLIALWTILLVWCLWSYQRQGRERHLIGASVFLALSYATKEVTYITVAIFGSYFCLLWLALVVRHRLAWRVAMTGHAEAARVWDVLLLLGTFSLPQLSAFGAPALRALGVQVSRPGSAEPGALVGTALMVGTIGASVAVGWLWRGAAWVRLAAPFYAIYLLLFTTFTTNPGGIVSGFWGSLDYWLQQQGVRRGGQPCYYYLLLQTLYEFLPIALASAGTLWRLGHPWRWLAPGAALAVIAGLLAAAAHGQVAGVAQVLGVGAHLLGPAAALVAVGGAGWILAARGAHPFTTFLGYWIALSLLAYGLAGEKMPWLSLHMALPILLLAAYQAGTLAVWLGRRGGWNRRALFYAAGGVAVVVLVPPLLLRFSSGPVLGSFVAGVALVGLAWLALRWTGQRLAGPAWPGWLAVGLLVPLGALTLRSATQLSYQHGDVAVEMAVYTQTAPDLLDVLRDIEALARRSGEGRDLGITIDASQGFSWPWAWYLRDYRRVDYPDLSNPSEAPRGSVLVLNASNEGVAAPFLSAYGEGRRFPHRWWFPEEYRMTAERLVSALLDPSTPDRLWEYFLRRSLPMSLGSSDAIAYYPPGRTPGRVSTVPAESAETRVAALQPVAVLGRAGKGPGEFDSPKGLAVDRDGNIYVADSRNHRVQKLDSTGRPLASTDGPGEGPGQFNEPWGIAVGLDGYVYVADTWNHRVQKLDSSLRPVTQWGGTFTDNQGRREGNEGRFYGPRDVVVNDRNEILVSDTGNKRLQRFDAGGRFLASYGGQGTGPGMFQEPVGLAIDARGRLSVADTWNRRIQRFSPDFEWLESTAVPSWRGQGILNKPYLTVDAAGNVFASDPEGGRVWRWLPTGELESLSVPREAGTPLRLPVGLAVEPSGTLLVAEAGTHQLRRLAVPP